MSRLLLRGGRVIDPASGLDETCDVLLADGKVAQIAASIDAPDAEVYDATGKIVAPGFIDLRARLREPGLEHAETIETGGKAAAAGGFTAVCCLPHTKPCNDSPTVTSFILARAAESSPVRVLPIGAITMGCLGEQLAEIGSMRDAGAVAVADGDATVMNSGLMRRAMRYADSFDLTIIAHCEDPHLARNGEIHEGEKAVRLGLRGVPDSAEASIVAREIILAAETRARTHLAHLSTKASVELVRRARQDGVPVTAEVAAHNLLLTVDDVPDYDSNFKVRPPFRDPEDRDALLAGLVDGTLDVIVSDHAPHTGNVKMQELERCPFGAIALETAAAAAAEALVVSGRASVSRFVELFSTGPAKALGRPDLGRLSVGGPADVTVLDVNRKWTFVPEESASKSRNTPFRGREFNGGPAATVVAGTIVWKAGT